MSKPYPLWFAIPEKDACTLCESLDEFISEFERVLTLFDEDSEAWRSWASHLKEPSRRQFIMRARYFARGELHRVPEYRDTGDSDRCQAIAVRHLRVEVPRHLIALMRRAGMRVERQIYHALGTDDNADHGHPYHGDHGMGQGTDGSRFPTEKLPNVLRFFFYMYMHAQLPESG